MIHLVLISAIGLLIFRVVWIIFGLFEKLFQSIASLFVKSDVKTSDNKMKPIKEGSVVWPSPRKSQSNKIKFEPFKMSELKVSKIDSNQIGESEVKPQQQMMKKEEDKLQVIEVQKPSTTKVVNRLDPKLDEQPIRKNSQGQNISYEIKIASLTEELEKQRQEKQKYIQRIQEIIEHIIQGHNQEDTSDEGDLSLISNLKQELKHSNQRFIDEKRQLTSYFQTQKRDLVEEYQQRIYKLVQGQEEKIKNYAQTIDEISKEIQQQNEKYNDLLQEKSKASGEPSNVNQNLLKKELERQKKTHKAAYDDLKTLFNEQENLIERLQDNQQKLQLKLQGFQISEGKKNNDEIQSKTNYEAQISSIKGQNETLHQQVSTGKQKIFNLQQELEEANFKLEHEKMDADNKQQGNSTSSDMINLLEQKYLREKKQREEEERKSTQASEELKFCQDQLQNAKQTQNELREKIRKHMESPQRSQRSFVRKEDVERHPQYLNLKRKLEQLQGRRLSPNFKSSKEQRELSPSFPIISNNQNRSAISPNSQIRYPHRLGTGTVIQSKNIGALPAVSTIMADRRYKTPIQKPVAYSTINEGGIIAEVYLGQTNILDEAQRTLIMHQISALKKITAKKTRLIYSSAQKVNKPITEYIISTPNMVLIAQLSNKKILGAFTQNAFSKDNKLTHSAIISKAVIFSITSQTFIPNQGKGEIIHFEDSTLIWGNKEFVVHCQEPLSISVNLNCQNSIYPTDQSAKDFLGSQNQKVHIEKLQVHRIFFG